MSATLRGRFLRIAVYTAGFFAAYQVGKALGLDLNSMMFGVIVGGMVVVLVGTVE